MSFFGLLNDTCTISARVESVDPVTGEQLFANRVIAANVPCALQHSGGNLERNARLITGDNTDRLYLLPQDFDIEKGVHIITVRGNSYRVREITDLGGRGRYLRLDLERTQLEEYADESES